MYDRDDKINFEGNYFKGRRAGKVKIYSYNGKLESEVEYSKTNYITIIRKYNFDGTLTFEGENLYGIPRKGKIYIKGILGFEGEYLYYKKLDGKGYDKNGNVIYELKNGNGKVIEYNDDKIEFEGEYLNGLKHGKGKQYYNNGNLSFEGEYLNGLKWNGIIYEPNNKNTYELKDGKGYIKEFNGGTGMLSYEGEYMNGKRNGKGKEYWNGKLIFEGEFLDGFRKNEYD